jgi:hypothetical protein
MGVGTLFVANAQSEIDSAKRRSARLPIAVAPARCHAEKRKRPRLIESGTLVRTALPRSLLTTSLRSDLLSPALSSAGTAYPYPLA